jgi:hypothetical protein
MRTWWSAAIRVRAASHNQRTVLALPLQFCATPPDILQRLTLIGEQPEPYVASPHRPTMRRLFDEEHRSCSSFYHPVHR